MSNIGTCIDDETCLCQIGDARHQAEVAAFAFHGQLAFKLGEVGTYVTSHVFCTNGEVSAALERAVDFTTRGTYNGIGCTFLNRYYMV